VKKWNSKRECKKFKDELETNKCGVEINHICAPKEGR
jgi:hypothetical protein